MSFYVLSGGTAVRMFGVTTDYTVGASRGTLGVTLYGPFAIANNQFGSGGEGYLFTGHFVSNVIANGTFNFINYFIYPSGLPYSFNQALTWNASVPPPVPNPMPLDGHWTGTTARNYPMSFDVSGSGSQASNFTCKTAYRNVGACSRTLEVNVPGPFLITNGVFQYTGSDFVFKAEFSTSSAAVGTCDFVNYNISGCGTLTQKNAWSGSTP